MKPSKIKVLLFIFCRKLFTSALTCDDILNAPGEKKWSIAELQTALPKEVVQCVIHLGKEKLEMAESEFMWSSIVTFYDGIASIPDDILMQLHWIAVAVKPEEYNNMSLSSVDVIQNFGLDYNLKEEQLVAIADRVREDWGGKEPEQYSHYDLMALRQILCAFNKSEIIRIHPEAYKEAAAVLGKLNNCKPEVLQGLATLAVHERAFGSPTKWNKNLKDIIGVVGNYIN